VGAPDGYRDDLGTARLDGASGFVEILVFARTYEQPGTVFRARDVEGVCVRRVCLGHDWYGAGCRVAGAAWPAGDRSRIVYFRPAPVTVVSLMAGIAQSRWPRRGHAICLASRCASGGSCRTSIPQNVSPACVKVFMTHQMSNQREIARSFYLSVRAASIAAHRASVASTRRGPGRNRASGSAM